MSKILDTVLETARDLHEAGVMDQITMREFEALGVPKVKDYSPAEIKRIRTKTRLSQPAFAACINASPSTVKAWEQGEKRPQGAALKLLEVVERVGVMVLIGGSAERAAQKRPVVVRKVLKRKTVPRKVAARKTSVRRHAKK